MEEETKKVLGYVVHQIHELRASQNRIEKVLELLTRDMITGEELGKVTRRTLDDLYKEVQRICGEDAEIIAILKKTNRY